MHNYEVEIVFNADGDVKTVKLGNDLCDDGRPYVAKDLIKRHAKLHADMVEVVDMKNTICVRIGGTIYCL